jgi:hypothetical protein
MIDVSQKRCYIMTSERGSRDPREKGALIRQYAAGEITWHVLRERGFDNCVEVPSGLGELG